MKTEESNTRALGHSYVILNRTKHHESQAGQQNNAAALTVFMSLTSVGFITLQDLKRDSNPQLLCANT